MLGSAPCSKNIGDGPIKWLLLKQTRKKKKTVGAPAPLINRSINISTLTLKIHDEL
jgi:hypothetical protein